MMTIWYFSLQKMFIVIFYYFFRFKITYTINNLHLNSNACTHSFLKKPFISHHIVDSEKKILNFSVVCTSGISKAVMRKNSQDDTFSFQRSIWKLRDLKANKLAVLLLCRMMFCCRIVFPCHPSIYLSANNTILCGIMEYGVELNSFVAMILWEWKNKIKWTMEWRRCHFY